MRIRIVQVLLLAQSVTTGATAQPKDDTYDYIVVGGAVSGLVVANRLTEDRNVSVLVIERGYFDDLIKGRRPLMVRVEESGNERRDGEEREETDETDESEAGGLMMGMIVQEMVKRARTD